MLCHREPFTSTKDFLHIFPNCVKLTAICRLDEVRLLNFTHNYTATNLGYCLTAAMAIVIVWAMAVLA